MEQMFIKAQLDTRKEGRSCAVLAVVSMMLQETPHAANALVVLV